MKTFTTLIAGLTAMIISGNAAALTVTVSGTPGAGTTTFTFSGSSTVTFGDARFQSYDDVGNEAGAWYGLGQFFDPSTMPSLIDDAIIAASSTASVSVNGASENIYGLYLLADSSNQNFTAYNWGIYLPPGNSSGIPVSTGDTVSWTGSLTVDLDFSNFVAGTYASDILYEGLGEATLDMTLVVTDPAQVPLPAAAPLFAIGLATSFGLYRRKRKAISFPR